MRPVLFFLSLLVLVAIAAPAVLPAQAAPDPDDLCSFLPSGYGFVGGSPDNKGVFPPVKGTADKCFAGVPDPKGMAFGGIGASVIIEKRTTDAAAQKYAVDEGIAAQQRGVTTPIKTGAVPGLGDYSQETSFNWRTADWYVIYFSRGMYLVYVGQSFYPGFTDQRGLVKPIAQGIDANLKSLASPAPTAVAPPSDAEKCFSYGLARLTMAEAEGLVRAGIAAGKDYDDIINDIELANVARGGSGSFICGAMITAAQDSPAGPAAPGTKNPADCFKNGVAKITWDEMVQMVTWGRQRQRPDADVKADIESLNRSRGGRGSLTCPVDALLPAPQGPTPREVCETLIQQEIAAKEDIKAAMADLETRMYHWRQLELAPEYRWLAYIAEVVAPGAFDPLTPAQMGRIIDRKHGRPYWGQGHFDEKTKEWVSDEAVWLQGDKAKDAEAEKQDYAAEYAQKIERIQQARQLPTLPEDIRQFYEPSRRLDEIAALQDLNLKEYAAHDAKLEEYQQKRDTGVPCK